MKKYIITFLLLVTFFVANNAQAATDSIQHKGKNHRGHNSQYKKEHRKGIRLFHRYDGSHGKNHSRGETHSRSHHARNHGDKGRGIGR